jgi:hypothetical protein
LLLRSPSWNLPLLSTQDKCLSGASRAFKNIFYSRGFSCRHFYERNLQLILSFFATRLESWKHPGLVRCCWRSDSLCHQHKQGSAWNGQPRVLTEQTQIEHWPLGGRNRSSSLSPIPLSHVTIPYSSIAQSYLENGLGAIAI